MKRQSSRSEEKMQRKFVYLIAFLIAITQLLSCGDNTVEPPKSSVEFIIRDEFGGLIDSVKCEIVLHSDEYSGITNSYGELRLDKVNQVLALFGTQVGVIKNNEL